LAYGGLFVNHFWLLCFSIFRQLVSFFGTQKALKSFHKGVLEPQIKMKQALAGPFGVSGHNLPIMPGL
jgi:hypothetical protein